MKARMFVGDDLIEVSGDLIAIDAKTDQETLPPDPWRDLSYSLSHMGTIILRWSEETIEALNELDGDILDAEFVEIENRDDDQPTHAVY